MEKLCKAYLRIFLAGTMSFSGIVYAATDSKSDGGHGWMDSYIKVCVEKATDQAGRDACLKKGQEAAIAVNKSSTTNSCSDTEATSSRKSIEDALTKAEEACAGLADEESSAIASTSIGACSKMIDDCDKMKASVNSLDPEETKSEEHTNALMQFANNTQLQQMGIQIPTQKKTDPLNDEEKEYYNKCPQMSEESFKSELKALEEKKDKLKEDTVKKKKEIIETMAKANKDMEEYNKKKADRAETARKSKADYEKEIQRIQQDHSKQTAELMKYEAETIKQRNRVDADYSALEKMRAKLATDLSGISVELSGACKGKYNEMLMKVPPANRRTNGTGGAVETRDYKLAFMKRCVRDQWFEVKQKYDKIKAELNAMRAEKDEARKQLAQINSDKQSLVAMKARQDQAIQSGEQDRAQAAMQLEQEMMQSAQRGIQQNQQNSMNLQKDITNIEEQEAKIEKRIAQLGKRPNGKMTLADAKGTIGGLKGKIASTESVIAGLTDASCKKMLEDITKKATEALNASEKVKPGTDKGTVAVHDADSQK